MRIRGSEDSGAVAVIVALFVFLFVGLSALVVDVGYWYTVQRQLQTAADAAALAGAQELITLGDSWTADAVRPVVTEYATGRNDRALLASSTVDWARTSVSADIVKVTVVTSRGPIFSRIFGFSSGGLSAQAVAKVGYVAGSNNPVPWSIPILRAKGVTAQIGGSAAESLTVDANSRYSRAVSVATGDVTIRAWNSQGVAEELSGAGRVIAASTLAAQGFADVSIVGDGERNVDGDLIRDGEVVYTPDETITFQVRVLQPHPAGEKVFLVFDPSGKNVSVTLDRVPNTNAEYPYLYTGKILAASVSPQGGNANNIPEYQSVPFDVAIGTGSQTKQGDPRVANVGRIVIRRPTYVISSVTVRPSVVGTTTSAVNVSVGLLDYTFGRFYPLKVTSGGGVTGNFMSIDFGELYRSTSPLPVWSVDYPSRPNSVYNVSGGSYGDYLLPDNLRDHVRYPDIEMRIHDVVYTQTGNIGDADQGQTAKAAWRWEGQPSFDDWLNADPPRPSNASNLIVVPVTERLPKRTGDDTGGTGAAPLRVVAFAVFYLEDRDYWPEPPYHSAPTYEGWVGGYFVEYSVNSFIIVDDPPDPLSARAAHLVSEGLDF